MGQVVFGDGQKAGGVLVNPVDDSRPELAVDTGEGVPLGVEQAVHQGK